jgi:hypothetical protein
VLFRSPVTLPLATVYQRTGTVIWRTDQTRDGVCFALQCGAHGGAHQHRDRGNFFLTAYGERLLVDAGDNRYVNPPPRLSHVDTIAHNALLINGQGQIGDNDHPVHGRLVDASVTGTRATVLADATACYRDVTLCHRRVVFEQPDLLVIADRVEPGGAHLAWALQGYDADGQAAWTCAGPVAVLRRPLAQLYVYFAEPVGRWDCAAAEMDGQRKRILHLEAWLESDRTTAIMVPVRTREAPPQFSRGKDGELRLAFRGRTHSIRRERETLTVNGAAYPL